MSDLYSLFEGVDDAHLEQAFATFERHDHLRDDVIVERGQVNESMLLIEDGEVAVVVDGHEVARMGPGSIVGEIGLFTHAVRTATVTAVSKVTLRELTRDALGALHDAENPIVARLEGRAVGQLVSRSRRLKEDLRALGKRAPSIVHPSAPLADSGVPVALVPAARQLVLETTEALADTPASTIRHLSRTAQLVAWREGQTLADEGAEGALSVVLGGRIAMRARLADATSVEVGTLEPGELFDIAAAVDGGARPSALVALEDVTIARFPNATAALESHDAHGSALRRALIVALADRVTRANAAFSLAKLTARESAEVASGQEPVRVPAVFGKTEKGWMFQSSDDFDTWFRAGEDSDAD